MEEGRKILNTIIGTNERVAKGSSNFFLARRIIEDQIKYIYYRDVNYWYSITSRFIREGKFADSIFRDEAIALAALQLQVIVGDHNPLFHKVGFLLDKDKAKFIHPAFRKDQSFEHDLYVEHSKLVGISEIESKKRFIEKIRILKRVHENVFPIFLYSADKIEAKEAVLVVGENIVVFDAQNQTYLADIPIKSIKYLREQHTAPHEREKLRKQLGHVSHLHQLVIDRGEQVIIRILTGNRDTVRKRVGGIFEVMAQSQRDKDIEQAEREKLEELRQQQLSFQSQQPTLTPTVPLTSVLVPSLPSVGIIMIPVQCWLFDLERMDVQEIRIRVQNVSLFVINAYDNKELLEIRIDMIKAWRQECIPEEVTHQLATKLKGQAYELYQLLIDGGPGVPPIRFLSLERWKIRNVLKTISDQLSIVSKEEFSCQMVNDSEDEVLNVILRWSSAQLEILDAVSRELVVEVPYKSLLRWSVNPVSEKLSGKFFKGITQTLSLDINSGSSPITVGTNEIPHLSNELNKIIFNSDSCPKYLPQRDIFRLPLRGTALEGEVFKDHSSLVIYENKILLADGEDRVLAEVPFSGIEAWGLHVRTPEKTLFLSSTEPQLNDISQLQLLLSVSSSDSFAKGLATIEKSTKSDPSDSGSEDQ